MNVVALTAAERDAVIEQLLAKLCAHYVFPDRAETLTLWVRGKQEAGGYDDITDATALCERLTAHLQEITSDQHRRLVVSVGGTPAIAEGKPTPPGIEEQKARAAIGNFGFYRVERLPGNIGYLDLRGFCPAEWAGDTGDKPVYVLTSSFTFSAAEEFAYTPPTAEAGDDRGRADARWGSSREDIPPHRSVGGLDSDRASDKPSLGYQLGGCGRRA